LFLFIIRLPVPTLAETAQRYLKTVAPLLNNDEFNETKKVCSYEDFISPHVVVFL
jgi:carnitine O-acetyltransferase